MLEYLIYTPIFVLSFLIVLGTLIFIHEMGHYSVARLFNVSVEKFSIGFGKPIYSHKAKSGTLWVVSRIPLGGFVKFLGDAGAASNPDTEKLEKIKSDMDGKYGKDAWKSCLHFKPLWQRSLVVLAGPMANFILAALIYAGIFFVFGKVTNAPIVGTVEASSAAEVGGLMVGDEFVEIDNKAVSVERDVRRIISLRAGDELTVIVKRDDMLKTLKITPRRKTITDNIGGTYEAGIAGFFFTQNITREKMSLPQSAVSGVGAVYGSVADTMHYIGRIFVGKENGKQLGSIVKIGTIIGKSSVDTVKADVSFGLRMKALVLQLLSIGAALSVGLGFANLMPIPVLDGGHLLFYGYEAVMRRPLSEKAQEIGFKVGFAVLITLFLVLTWNDIGYVSGVINKTG